MMKTTLLAFCLFASCAFGQLLPNSAHQVALLNQRVAAAASGYTLIFTNCTAGTAAGTTTTAGDTTGCALLIAASHGFSAAGSLSDSKGNTWTAVTAPLEGYGTPRQRLYYCVNPTVGAAHTFTTTADYSVVSVLGFTGNGASPYDTTSGTNDTAVGTVQMNIPITPSADNSIIISAQTWVNPDPISTVDSGFSIIGQKKNNDGGLIGGVAWKLQTTAATVQETWTNASSGGREIQSVAFKP